MVKDTFYIFRTELCIIYMCICTKGYYFSCPNIKRGGGGKDLFQKSTPALLRPLSVWYIHKPFFKKKTEEKNIQNITSQKMPYNCIFSLINQIN